MKDEKLQEYAQYLSCLWRVPCEVIDKRAEPAKCCYAPCDRRRACQYGCSEAYRWGGRYIYYCKEGLTLIAASVSNDQGELEAGLVLGPIVIGDAEDLIRPDTAPSQADWIRSRPQIPTDQVNAMAEIMAAVTQSLSGAPHTITGSVQFDYSVVKHADTVYKVMEYVKQNCGRRISLEELAALTHFNKTYLSRIFKKETGETLSSFMMRMRVERAKELLLESELDLSQISAQLGFEDQSYFTKVFKMAASITPGQFRAVHKKK